MLALTVSVHMNKILTTTALLTLLISCAPQISKTQITSDLNSYSNYITNRNYEKSIEYMPSEFWKAYDKSEFLINLKNISNRIGNFEMKNMKVENVSEVIKSNRKFFKVISYSANLELDISDLNKKEIETFETKFGKENINLDEINNRIIIFNTAHMITVFDKELNQWKYLEYNINSVKQVYGVETLFDLEKYVR